MWCISSEIYKSIDKEGNVSFSSIAPLNSKIVKTVDSKKLIKKLSVIHGASAQNKKIIAITNELKQSRIQRNKIRNENNKNYNKEITQIKNQRLQGLKNLTTGESILNSEATKSQLIKDSITRMLEYQE